MKKKLFIPIAALLFFFSCKKNDSDAPSPLADKIKKIISTSPNNNSETEYFYDAAGRISKTTSNDGRVVELTYEPGRILTKVTNSNGVFNSIGELNSRGLLVSSSSDGTSFSSNSINSNGFIEKEVLINFTNGVPTLTQTRIFFYNASTGLLDSLVQSLNNNRSTLFYTAYSSYPDNFLKNTGYAHIAPSLKFLPAETKVRLVNDPPGFFRTTTHSYEFDNKNRLTKRTSVSQNSTSTTQYIYYD